jgi:hypothetical protein
MASKKGPGRPARNQALKPSSFIGVAAEPQNPLDAFELRITEPKIFVALFHILGSYQCNQAYLVIEERRIRIISRSPNQSARPGEAIDELRQRAHIVSGSFDCSSIYYYHAHPDILGTYFMRLNEDQILPFVCSVSPIHTSVLLRIQHNDRSSLEIVLKTSEDLREGTRSFFPLEQQASPFPLEPYFDLENEELPALSMTVPFDDFKKTIVMISKSSPTVFEIFRTKDHPIQFKWRSTASRKQITHAFDNEAIKLIDNSADRVISFEVDTNDIKRFFTSCKTPISVVQLDIMANGRTIILRSGIEPLRITVFTNQIIAGGV